MRVLVTNTRNQQAYSVVVALRRHADRIVVTTHGANRLSAALAPSACSRLVDARYRVPQFPAPWLRLEATEAEERYVTALLAICRRESIDVILPSRDDVVYVLARHKRRFIDCGVAVPVCDFATQARIMDKHQMLCTAAEAGIPIPRTHRPTTRRELDEAIADVGLPAVIKPRFGAGGIGIQWVRDRGDVARLWHPPQDGLPDLLVQEFIPGRTMLNARSTHMVIDPHGRCTAYFGHLSVRCSLWKVGHPLAATESTTDATMREQSIRLLQAHHWWGGGCVEWKYDARDGRTKLLEPNARIGATVWPAVAAGINVPLALAEAALGREREPVIDARPPTAYVDPVMEVLSAGTYLANRVAGLLPGRRSRGPLDIVPSLREWLRSVRRSYRARRRVTSDYWRALPRDPLPPLLFWSEQAIYFCRRWRDSLPGR